MKDGHSVSSTQQTQPPYQSLTQLQKDSGPKNHIQNLKFPNGPNLNGQKNYKNSASSSLMYLWRNWRKLRIFSAHQWTLSFKVE